MDVSRHFSMAQVEEHFHATLSGDLTTVESFLQAHPDTLNQVRSTLLGWGRRRGREEEEEKERNSP